MTSRKPWEVFRVSSTGIAHIIPRDDLVEHVTDESCICGPDTEVVPRLDGSMGWMVTHHSLDGREAHELD